MPAVEDDIVAAVIELLDPDDLADAPDWIEWRALVLRRMRLDHPDAAWAIQDIAIHLALARFEDVMRQLRPGKKNRTRQREDRNPQRSLATQVNSKAESRRL